MALPGMRYNQIISWGFVFGVPFAAFPVAIALNRFGAGYQLVLLLLTVTWALVFWLICSRAISKSKYSTQELKNKRFRSNLKTIAVATLFSGFVVIWIPDFIKRSERSEMEVNLRSLYTFQMNYKNEFGHFTDDFKRLGFRPEGRLRSKIFVEESELPQWLKDELAETDYPRVSEESYQIIAVTKYGNGEFEIWQADNNQKVRRLRMISSFTALSIEGRGFRID